MINIIYNPGLGGNSLWNVFFEFKKGCSIRSCLFVGGSFVSQGPHVLWGQWKYDCGFGHWLGTLSIHSCGLSRLEGHRIIVSILIRFILVWVGTFFSMKVTSFHTQTIFFKEESFTWPFSITPRVRLPFFLSLKTQYRRQKAGMLSEQPGFQCCHALSQLKSKRDGKGFSFKPEPRYLDGSKDSAKNHCRINSFGSRSSTSEELTVMVS